MLELSYWVCCTQSQPILERSSPFIPRNKYSQEFGQHKLLHNVWPIFFTDPSWWVENIWKATARIRSVWDLSAESASGQTLCPVQGGSLSYPMKGR